MSNISFTRTEINLIRKYYPNGVLSDLVYLTGRSEKSIRYKACKLKIRVKNRKETVKLNRSKVAEIIEDYVINPDRPLMELADKYNVSYWTVSKYISYCFTYKGENKEIIVLKSKVC